MAGNSLQFRRGTITVILIGLVSVMILFAFTISRRMSGHTQLLTLGDYTQIARYFLESYVHDIMRQVQAEANKTGSTVFNVFRNEATNGKTLSPSLYSPCPMLEQLRKELKIKYVGAPQISFSNMADLSYPALIKPDFNVLKRRERKGLLRVSAAITFQKRDFNLEVSFPFSVVHRLAPVFKDFVFFADQIQDEQRSGTVGSSDGLNVLIAEDGEIPLHRPATLSLPGLTGRQRPWLFHPPLNDQDSQDRDKWGKVYLGPDQKPIFLNLAGDRSASGRFSDVLSLIPPTWFNVVPPSGQAGQTSQSSSDKVVYEPLSLFQSTSNVQNEFLMLALNEVLNSGPGGATEEVFLGVMGYCSEVAGDSAGIFAGTLWTLDDFFKGDPTWNEYRSKGVGYLGASSGLRFFGFNQEDPINILNQGILPGRAIYGPVLGRFLLMSFYRFTSAEGGGAVVEYDEAAVEGPEYRNLYNVVFRFKPRAGRRYQDYMSRIVSGGSDLHSIANFKDWHFALDPTGKSYGRKTPLNFRDFKSKDGFSLSGEMADLLRSWFSLDPRKTPSDTSLNNIQARIGRYFSDQKAFENYAKLKSGKFLVDGICFINGDLKLDDLTMKSEDISGGIVIVNGSIKLGNITRGYDKKIVDGSNLIDFYNHVREKVPMDSFLTFVSLNTGTTRTSGVSRSRPGITLTGNLHAGVQLVVYDPSPEPAGQITWDCRDNVVFAGGLILSRPNVSRRVEEFAGVCKNDADHCFPAFMYPPGMAEQDPACIVQIMHHMRGYRLTANVSGTTGS